MRRPAPRPTPPQPPNALETAFTVIWVTWVTWGFAGLIVLVVAVAVAISTGRLDASFGAPYERENASVGQPDPRPDVDWSEPADGRAGADLRPATDPQHHPRTTGEPAHGRYEAQDR